jgi:hypothetical protein
MAAGPLADGLVAFACSQDVSEPVSWLQVLLLRSCGIFLLSGCK